MPFHTRRELLASVACASAGLAGCSELAALPSSESIEASDTTSESPFTWTATLDSPMTDSHPAKIRLRLQNDSSETLQTAFGPVSPFSVPLSGTDEVDTRLVLFHPELGPNPPPTAPIDGCWKRDPEQPPMAVHLVETEEFLSPGDQVSSTYTLYGPRTAETCFPDGTYTFRDTATIESGEERSLDLEVGVQIEDGRVAALTAAQSISAIETTTD